MSDLTPEEKAAWSVANAAIAAAYDVTIRAMCAEFVEKFPKVDALWGVYAESESESGTVHVGFDAVRIGDKRKSHDEIKPENAKAIDAHLDHWLGSLDLPGFIQDAIDRATSDDGLIWVKDRAVSSFESAEAPS